MLYRLDDDTQAGKPWNFGVAVGDKVYPTRAITFGDLEDIQRLLDGKPDYIKVRVFIDGLFTGESPDMRTAQPHAVLKMLAELVSYFRRYMDQLRKR